MKKITLLVAFFAIALAAFGQQTNPSPTLTKQDYLKKSKHQKTIAWVLLGTGIFSTGLGTVKFNFAGSEDGEVNNSPSAVFLVTGLTAIAASVPLFIASSKNKKRSATVSFRMERTPAVQQQNFVYQSYPALSFRLSL